MNKKLISLLAMIAICQSAEARVVEALVGKAQPVAQNLPQAPSGKEAAHTPASPDSLTLNDIETFLNKGKSQGSYKASFSNLRKVIDDIKATSEKTVGVFNRPLYERGLSDIDRYARSEVLDLVDTYSTEGMLRISNRFQAIADNGPFPNGHEAVAILPASLNCPAYLDIFKANVMANYMPGAAASANHNPKTILEHPDFSQKEEKFLQAVDMIYQQEQEINSKISDFLTGVSSEISGNIQSAVRNFLEERKNLLLEQKMGVEFIRGKMKKLSEALADIIGGRKSFSAEDLRETNNELVYLGENLREMLNNFDTRNKDALKTYTDDIRDIEKKAQSDNRINAKTLVEITRAASPSGSLFDTMAVQDSHAQAPQNVNISGKYSTRLHVPQEVHANPAISSNIFNKVKNLVADIHNRNDSSMKVARESLSSFKNIFEGNARKAGSLLESLEKDFNKAYEAKNAQGQQPVQKAQQPVQQGQQPVQQAQKAPLADQNFMNKLLTNIEQQYQLDADSKNFFVNIFNKVASESAGNQRSHLPSEDNVSRKQMPRGPFGINERN